MEPDNLIALALLIIGLAAAAFGAAAATVLPAAGRARRSPNGDRTALEWAARERPVLGITTFGISAAGVALTWGAAAWLLYRMAPWPALLATAALAAVLAWIVQAIPAALVATAPERAMRALFWPLRAIHAALTPVTALYYLVWRVAHKPRGAEELDSIVEEMGEETEDLEEQEREMIRGVMDLDTTTARMIMAPRMDIIAAEADAAPAEVVALIGSHGYSRIPIYEETVDNIVGIIYAKDLLKALGAPEQLSLRSLARKPYFVPESKKVDELLREFRQQRTHVAVVVDEYGGTAGLVTLEDLLEEIVGEIEDEYDPQKEEPIVKVSDTEAVLDAGVSIEDLNDLFETEIEHEGYDTVGGLVYAHLGKIPNAGDQVQVNGVTISVVSTVGHRIKKVRAVHSGVKGEAAPP